MDDISIGKAQRAKGETKLESPALDALVHAFSSMTHTYLQINEIFRRQQSLQDEVTALCKSSRTTFERIPTAPKPRKASPFESDNDSGGTSVAITASDGDDEGEGDHFPLAALPRHSANVKRGQPIFANEFFEIRKSPVGGLGAFAVQDLQHGDRILMERAVIRATDVDKNLIDRFEALSLADKGLVLDLAMHKPPYLDGDDSLYTRLKAIFKTNYFACTAESPGHGLFLVASRFNHACRPNMTVEYAFRRDLDALVFTVAPRGHGVVPAGTELTINYGKDVASLNAVYGFECACGGDCKAFRRMQAAREWGTSS